ncbi:hypothetical protein AAVH_32990, partial [Aphelenchoides avenae]
MSKPAFSSVYGSNFEVDRRLSTLLRTRSPLMQNRVSSILKVDESKHFHYEYVELGPVAVTLKSDVSKEQPIDHQTYKWTLEVESNAQK